MVPQGAGRGSGHHDPLQTIAERASGNLFDVENFVQREFAGAAGADATAPAAAGRTI